MANKNIYINDFDEITKRYLNEIGNTKPLSRKEERKLWKKYKTDGDLSARNRIVKSNLKFIAKIANLYRGRGLSYLDLIAEGNLGFMKALDYFDGKRDNRILSYSVWWIRQTISDALEKRNLMVGDYTDDELDYKSDEIHDQDVIMYDPSNSTSSLNEENKNLLKKSMSVLNKREKKMLTMYYGLDGNMPCTLSEVGEEFNLTRERVRQINDKSLKKMRSHILEKSLM